MALYFPDEFIQEVMEKNDIVSTVSAHVKLKQSGSTQKGLCPFHREKTPSFSVSADKQLFYCFGCGKGGTVINFVMYINNLDFVEAVTMLAEKAGMSVPDQSGRTDLGESRQAVYKINSMAGRFFYNCLLSDEGTDARQYILKRRLAQNTVNRFGLGYAPPGNALISHLRENGFTDELLLASGVAGKNDKGYLYDRFRNRLMFPIIDMRKNIIGFGGRVMDDSVPKYLNSPETVAFSKSHNLFGLNFAKNSKEEFFILVEGYMDVISLHQEGITSAVATLGTALTPEQARIIKRSKSQVVIAYDSDEAGQNATKRAIEILADEGLTVKVINMGNFKDPDEYIKANGAGAFKKLIVDSQLQIEYKISRLRERYDIDDPHQKLQYINSVAAEFANLKSPVEREIYVKKISDETGVTANSIFSEISRLDAVNERKNSFSDFSAKPSVRAFKSQAPEKAKALGAQKIVLNIMCYDGDTARQFEDQLSKDDFEPGICQKLYEILTKNGAALDARLIVSQLQDDPSAAEILLDDKNIEDTGQAMRQAVDIIKDYRKIKMKQASAAGDIPSLEEINKLMKGNTKEGGLK